MPTTPQQKQRATEAAEPTAILRYWQGIEYLSPGSPPKEAPDNKVWNARTEADMPWSVRHRERFVETKDGVWRFLLWIGIVPMEGITRQLIEKFQVEEDAERVPRSAPAMICLTATADGELFGEIGVSTLPWAMSNLLARGKFPGSGWGGPMGAEDMARMVLRDLLIAREIFFLAEDAEGKLVRVEGRRPFMLEDAKQSYLRYAESVKWPIPDIEVTALRIEAKWVKKDKDGHPYDMEGGLLNSFIIDDLALVHDEEADKADTGNIHDYLFGLDPARRIDVTKSLDAAHRLLRPGATPLGKWPTAGHHHLAFAQQITVNAIMSEIDEPGGVFGANGPPGTGKTTLARDLIASVIVERARVLASFDDPNDALGRTLPVRDREYGGYRLDPRLLGFEMVVASSNNGAVENVTGEIPSIGAVDPSWLPAGNYFTDVADTIFSDQPRKRAPGTCWGLLAAVLGKAENRQNFVNAFWFAGIRKDVEHAADPSTDPTARISLNWYLKNGPRPDWKTARAEFRASVKRVKDRLDELDRLALAHHRLLRLGEARQDIDAAEAACAAPRERLLAANELLQNLRQFQAAKDLVAVAARRPDVADDGRAAIEQEIARLTGDLKKARGVLSTMAAELAGEEAGAAAMKALEPRGLSATFNRVTGTGWYASYEAMVLKVAALSRQKVIQEQQVLALERDVAAEEGRLADHDLAVDAARLSVQEAQEELAICAELLGVAVDTDATSRLAAALLEQQAAQSAMDAARARQVEVEARIAELQRLAADDIAVVEGTRFEGHVMDLDFHGAADDVRQMSSPWMDDDLHHLRADCFIKALALHKAFVMNAGKLRANLSLAADLLKGKVRPAHLGSGLQHIWASFFLVVPVVSSTFASFGRLFDGVGCQELGWVFIDEAGQATPQAAVGAVWRAKRAVLIGDPKQLKPVVPLPRQIIEILREREGLPHGWHPERNSAQVLADRATRYGALMDTDEDHPYWVGSPLRVHRRCRSPMFDVANQIAYGGLMVQGTTYHVADEKNFPCGSSAWIDVPATVSDGGHYIPAQGEAAVRLLQALASAYDGAAPPVYVITPFKDVAGKFQTRIGGRGGMPWNWVNRSVGTIHTFQGKETDFVIILLGGAQEVPGARQWAAEEPNMLNVALTRAKKAVYVVGDHRHWSVLPNFSELARWLPRISGAAFDGRPSATITELHHRRPPAS